MEHGANYHVGLSNITVQLVKNECRMRVLDTIGKANESARFIKYLKL